jgi:beta-glucosidase
MSNYSLIASVLLLIIFLSIELSQTVTSPVRQLPYQDPSLPIKKRVDDLVLRMTLDETVSQMMNAASLVERLGIRQYEWNEGLHGVARAGVAIVLSASDRAGCDLGHRPPISS